VRRGSHSYVTATRADAETGEANGGSRGCAAAQAEKRDSRGSRGGQGRGRSGHGVRGRDEAESRGEQRGKRSGERQASDACASVRVMKSVYLARLRSRHGEPSQQKHGEGRPADVERSLELRADLCYCHEHTSLSNPKGTRLYKVKLTQKTGH
jgi:hypothetical protein